MSLIPLLSEIDAFRNVEQLLEGPFGLDIHPVDIFRPRHQRSLIYLHPRSRYSPYILPSYVRHEKPKELAPNVDKDGFHVCMDVSHFNPNELIVKTLDRTVVIEGKHEEREDEHGFVQRHFIRKYTLPKGFDPKNVVSTISSDGVLSIKATPPPSKGKSSNERIVQIQQTGPAHLSIKQPEQNKKATAEEASNEAPEQMETK